MCRAHASAEPGTAAARGARTRPRTSDSAAVALRVRSACGQLPVDSVPPRCEVGQPQALSRNPDASRPGSAPGIGASAAHGPDAPAHWPGSAGPPRAGAGADARARSPPRSRSAPGRSRGTPAPVCGRPRTRTSAPMLNPPRALAPARSALDTPGCAVKYSPRTQKPHGCQSVEARRLDTAQYRGPPRRFGFARAVSTSRAPAGATPASQCRRHCLQPHTSTPTAATAPIRTPSAATPANNRGFWSASTWHDPSSRRCGPVARR